MQQPLNTFCERENKLCGYYIHRREKEEGREGEKERQRREKKDKTEGSPEYALFFTKEIT